jgi:superoxide dismutase, Fe-Mn family
LQGKLQTELADAGVRIVTAAQLRETSNPASRPVSLVVYAWKIRPLGYAFDALEPYIDTLTMTIHHDRHHGAYVAALNGLVEKYPGLATAAPVAILADLPAVPDAVRAPVRNNLGGHWNHSFFWELTTPDGAKEPCGELESARDSAFGSPAKLTEKVNAAGLGRFGSG